MTPSQGKPRVGRWLAIAASVVMLATVTTAILVSGTPSERRAAKLDERRVTDLQRLARAIDDMFESDRRLPADVATVAAKPGSRLVVVDPVTSLPYEYEQVDNESYRLCAVFVTDTAVTPSQAGWQWDHASGRQCFERRAPDPDRNSASMSD